MPYRLSPYCVVFPQPGLPRLTLIHALFGTKFDLDAELFARLASSQAIPAPSPEDPLAPALAELIREAVLLDEAAYSAVSQEAAQPYRLNPIELAFLREFNEGGYHGDTSGQAPPYQKEIAARRRFPLRLHSDLPITSFTTTLLARQSRRFYASSPLPLAQLEKFLQLAALAAATVEHPDLGTTSLRNYPSGGARYPLEIYPLIQNVRGLPKGLYHYQPFSHRLDFLGPATAYRRALFQVASHRMAIQPATHGQPAVLFLITAAFARTAWKYRGIPLHLILQEVGALYQTMYLAAESLGLAACPLGSFPERAVAEILKVDSRDEPHVGCFTLGVPASPAPLSIESLENRPAAGTLGLHLSNGLCEVIPRNSFAPTVDSAGHTTAPILRGRFQSRLSPRALQQWRSLSASSTTAGKRSRKTP